MNEKGEVIMEKIKQRIAVWRERRLKNQEKTALVKRIVQLQDDLDSTLEILETERESRSAEREQRIDRESVLKQKVRELDETIAVNKITIENLTYETTRNRERLRAELAMNIAQRKSHLEGDQREQLS